MSVLSFDLRETLVWIAASNHEDDAAGGGEIGESMATRNEHLAALDGAWQSFSAATLGKQCRPWIARINTDGQRPQWCRLDPEQLVRLSVRVNDMAGNDVHLIDSEAPWNEWHLKCRARDVQLVWPEQPGARSVCVAETEWTRMRDQLAERDARIAQLEEQARVKKSLRRIVCALVIEHHQFDPKAPRSDAPREISELVYKHLHRPISSETVRTVLRECWDIVR